MGKIQLLTEEQKLILDELKNNDYFKNNFYFTGGTALSLLYLQHRYSEDIDIFTDHEYDSQTIFSIIKNWSTKHNFSFKSRRVEIVYMFYLIFKNGITLKVDFNYYQCRRLDKTIDYEGFPVDSLVDIAVNKLLTISQRTDVKDFVDFYYLSKKFTVWDLMEGLRIKFRIDTDPLLIGYDFLKVEDFNVMPRMIKPLKLEDLKKFFRKKSLEVGGRAVEK